MKAPRGNIIPATLAASTILALIASMSYLFTTREQVAAVGEITLSPQAAVVDEDSTVTVSVQVSADTAVNVFGGVIRFDEAMLSVEKIDYNISVANLWATAPWYEKGDGTISFGGGTTEPGGFTGSGTLLTITFKPRHAGEATIKLADIQLLQHDGYGTPLNTNSEIDSLLTVAPRLQADSPNTMVIVRNSNQSGDLNNDGVVSLADASILLRYLATGDGRGDLTGDGRVTLADMSVLMSQR